MTVTADGMPAVGSDGKLLPWDAPYEACTGHPRSLPGAHAFPGQPIRYPVESKGRYKPVDTEAWLESHALSRQIDEGHAKDYL